MFATISKWGNSFGVRIPRIMIEKMDIFEGERVELIAENNQILIRKIYQLENLLKQVTLDNIHSEVETGAPVGKEAW